MNLERATSFLKLPSHHARLNAFAWSLLPSLLRTAYYDGVSSALSDSGFAFSWADKTPVIFLVLSGVVGGVAMQHAPSSQARADPVQQGGFGGGLHYAAHNRSSRASLSVLLTVLQRPPAIRLSFRRRRFR